jgi:hypothetical protein
MKKLAPASAFNPNQIWIQEQAKEAALLSEEQQTKIENASKGIYMFICICVFT